MIRFTRSRSAAGRLDRATNRLFLSIFAALLLVVALPAAANAALTITGFSISTNTKQAAAHPNVTIVFNRGVSNTEDLRDFTINYPAGMLFNAEAAVAKCSSTQFSSDTCPSASVVGDFTSDTNLEILGFSFPATANGTIYVLAPSGVEHATLGYTLRPPGYAKSFSKQTIQLRTDSDGGARTVTTNIMRAQSLSWPRLWGSTNIAVRKLTLRYNARANAAKTGPYFTLNPSACTLSNAQLSAVSYASETAAATSSYTPTGCTSTLFVPTLNVDVDDPTSGGYTGSTFTVTLPQIESGTQHSTIKTLSASLPVGTDLNLPLLGTYGTGCLESELLADTCPEQTLVGEASAVVPHFPPAFTGEVYLMEPTTSAFNGAVVLRGPRNMKSIMRFTNTVQGSGTSARVVSNWDYMPQIPISKLQVHVYEPLLKNPACPGGAKSTSATFTGHSLRTRSATPTYSTTCTAAPPAPPAITDPASGTSTNDTTPTFSGTAVANASITVYDGATSIGTTTADASGFWTFTPAASIGSGLSSITATATTGSGTSSASAAVQITVDQVAPSVPVITTDSGPTNDNTPTIGGTAEDFATIAIRNGATYMGTTTADASGIWSYTPSTLADGAYSFNATATDAAGNTSAATAAHAMTVDTVVPAAPTITTPVNSSTTEDNTPTIAGAAEIGASVRVTRTGNTSVCSTTASVTGSWSCDASPALPDGSYAITAVAVDAAGNVSVASATVNFSIAPYSPVQIETGPEGGLPIDVTHLPSWYTGGYEPVFDETFDPHPFPQWSFSGAASGQYECSLEVAGQPDVFTTCTSPFSAPFESLNDTVQTGTDYRFVVRDASNPSAMDVALFSVGPFEPTWDVQLSTYQALGHPDMQITASNPFGDPMFLIASAPDHFWGSLTAVPVKCSLASAQAGTCATTAPNSKIGSISFTVNVNPVPHNDIVPPHEVTRTFDTYLTPATRPGDAAGIAVSIRAIDDAAYGSRDYGTINYIGRLRLRYSENVVHPDEPEHYYNGVSDPYGMDIWLQDIPNSTAAASGVTPGPDGVADLHVRSITANVLGNAPWYDAPLLWNVSQCDNPGTFTAMILSTSYNPNQRDQEYQATGCENLDYDPAVTQFSVSDNGATDHVSDLTVGVNFPAGNSTTRSAVVDMPREFVANPTAVQACLSAEIMVEDPQANCPDTANLGTATATTPLLPYALTGDVIGEDSGGSLPNIYMVFKDPDIGLDTRIRGSASVLKSGTVATQAQGDFIRTRLNIASDGSPLDLPSMPLSGLVLNLHQEDAGVTLPDSTVSLGSIIKIGTGYACNDTAVARFVLKSWAGPTRHVMSPVMNFDCADNGQTVANGIQVVSGPANGEIVNADTVSFTLRNNTSSSTRIRTGVDNGDHILADEPLDDGIEPNSTETPTTIAGDTRTVTYSGLVNGRVYKFMAQNTASGAGFDQERRTFKVQMEVGVPVPPVITSPSTGLITNDNTISLVGTANNYCTVLLYDGAAAIGSTTPTVAGDWSFDTAVLPDGTHSFITRCINSLGDQSADSAVVNVTVDTVPPTAPQITSPVDAQTGTISTVVGTAEPGSTVTVREGATLVCTAVTNGSGDWSCSRGTPFSNADHTICATATDAANNTGVTDCVQFGDPSASKARILTGPEGGLPIDVTHDLDWFNAGNPDAEWSFEGGGAAATYECSLVKAAQADSFQPCTSPFATPFEALDDSIASGTDYRFRVRIAGLAASADTALFRVGQFAASSNISLTTHQALGHPDLTMAVTNPFGHLQRILMDSPDNFMGSLAANPIKCQLDSAAAGTCATTAPEAKIGTITITADFNPNPHNDTVPPHQVTRTVDAYLTPAKQPGDAAGIALSIRVIDDPAYGSLDYGTINYVARMKLRYDGPNGEIDYDSVFNPRGMSLVIEDLPVSTVPSDSTVPGPAGAADLQVRSILAQIDGTDFDYAGPLLYNSSDCVSTGTWTTSLASGAAATTTSTQSYQATGCENVEYEPSIIQFGVSDTAATDLINGVTIGVYFPEGNATTRRAVVDMPREFVANISAVQACPTNLLLVPEPRENCEDVTYLGTATAASPLLPYALTGYVIAEDVGSIMPSLYMVFQDPDIGLDTRIRASIMVLRTGYSAGVAAGDFIRAELNTKTDGSHVELPSIPLNSLVIDLHQEDAGTVLPDGSTSLGPIIKVGATYACNETSVARFILQSWAGHSVHLMSTILPWNCAGNGQTPAEAIDITAGPANGDVVTTDTVSFSIRNALTVQTKLRNGIDDGALAEVGLAYDANIESSTSAPYTAAGDTRVVTFSGLQDGRVYKFLVQNTGTGSSFDQERRTFLVDLP